MLGPGTSTRNICTSPRPRSSSSKTSLSCPSAGTSAWKRSIAVLIRSWVDAMSPRYWLAVAEEASGRAVVGKGGQPDRGVSALLNRTRRAGAAHIGSDPAGAHRVHLQPALIRCEGAGQRVERRLREPISRTAAVHIGELPGAAGDVDDPRCIAPPQEGHKCLNQAPGTEGVDFEHLVGAVEVVVRRADRIAVDAGVVDQRIEVPGLRADLLLGRVDIALVGNVELDRHDPLGLLDVVRVPGAGEHDEAVIRGELTDDLRADASAGPCDQRDPSILSHASSLRSAQLDLVALEQLLADHHALDLGGALSDQEQRGVAVEPLDLVLLRVAVAAVDAERLLHDLLAGLGGEQLGHARLEIRALPRVLHARGLQREQPGGLDLRGHVRQLELDRLVLRDRLAERLALLRVAQRQLEGALGDANSAGRHVDPADLERVHHLREALSEPVLLPAEDAFGTAAVAVVDELG